MQKVSFAFWTDKINSRAVALVLDLLQRQLRTVFILDVMSASNMRLQLLRYFRVIDPEISRLSPREGKGSGVS